MVVPLFVFAAVVSCSVRVEISPCNCEQHPVASNTIQLTCDGLDSFNRVFDSLQNRFSPNLKIHMLVNRSQLEDMETKAFGDMNLKLKNLRLNHDHLKTVPESSFRNLTNLEFLSLAYNQLEEVPRHIFPHMPNLGTLDLGAQNIRRVRLDDFRRLPRMEHLLLFRNKLSQLDADSLPSTLKTLHLSRNNLTALNGTLRHMQSLRLVFLNDNQLTTLDNELPLHNHKLISILAHNNNLTHMPAEIKTLSMLSTLYVRENQLRSLNGTLRYSRHLEIFEANQNQIEALAADEFQDCEKLVMLDLNTNLIRSVNGSLLPLKLLRSANFSRNLLTNFSLNEIRGLQNLRVLDLSWNQIELLSGKMLNNVEHDLYVIELRLQHNHLKSLDGAMVGMNRLVQLDLSYNQLSVISPDDLIGLEELDVLDISYNTLLTLEETSKSFLPKLTKLNASNNNLTKLDKDFYGLPALCVVDLSNNHIASISPNLVDKTRCISHSVITKMDILLQDNPVLCRNDIDQLIQTLNAQEARIKGVGHCMVPQEEYSVPMSPLLHAMRPIAQVIMPVTYAPIPQELSAETDVVVVNQANNSQTNETEVNQLQVTTPAIEEPVVSEVETTTPTTTTTMTMQPMQPLPTTTTTTTTTTSTTEMPTINTTVYTTHSPPLDEFPEEPPLAIEPAIFPPTMTPILSNVILAVEDDQLSVVLAAPDIVPEHSHVLFDDIQPSDIVTLPDPLPDDDHTFAVRDHNVMAAVLPVDILSATPPPSAILTDEIQQT